MKVTLSVSNIVQNPVVASHCCQCGGPIVSRSACFPIWMHDNSGGWYAGREMDHDACGPDELTPGAMTGVQGDT